MSKVSILYNKEKDAYNWVRIITKPAKYGIKKKNRLVLIPVKIQKEVKKLYKNKSLNNEELSNIKNHFPSAKNFVKSFLKENIFLTKVVNEKKKKLEYFWRKKEYKYFKKLTRITKKPIYSGNFTCYLTTLNSCPYNEKGKWFMTPAFSDLSNQIYVICHELMHLQFLHWYRDNCKEKGLSENQIQDLKEAITFILNESEFDDIITYKDKGYPNHQKLRKKLKKIWIENNNFKVFLNKAIEIVKTLQV